MLHCLLIAQRVERPRRSAIAFGESARFLQKARREHLARPLIDLLVERFPVRVQADAENIEAAEWVAALLPETGHRGPRADADFQSSHNLGNIIGVDCLRGGRVEAAEQSVQIIWPAFCCAFSQSRAQCFRAGRSWK